MTDLFLQGGITKENLALPPYTLASLGKPWTLAWQFLDFSSSAHVSLVFESSLEMGYFSLHGSTILGFIRSFPTGIQLINTRVS